MAPTKKSLLTRRVAALVFSAIMSVMLGLLGLLAGMFLLSPHTDEVTTESVAILTGWVFALGSGTVCVWKFWPRRSSQENAETAQRWPRNSGV